MAVRAEQAVEDVSPLTRRAMTVLLVCSMGAGTAFAADASLPNEPLHVVKVAAEDVRLGISQSDQRVAILLDIAEARLTEATVLAAVSRDAEADAAVSAYAERVAEAAAEVQLKSVTEPAAAEQFRSDVRKHQAAIPAGHAESSAVAIAAQLRPTLARENQAQPHEIAAAAADVADRAATSVEQKVTTTSVTTPAAASTPSTPATSAAATSSVATTTAASPSTATPPVTAAPEPPGPSKHLSVTASAKAKEDDEEAKTIEAAAKAARESAERAKQAAAQAKESASKADKNGKHKDK